MIGIHIYHRHMILSYYNLNKLVHILPMLFPNVYLHSIRQSLIDNNPLVLHVMACHRLGIPLLIFSNRKRTTHSGWLQGYIDYLMQDCSISSALAVGILQSCTKPSISTFEKRVLAVQSTITAIMRTCFYSYQSAFPLHQLLKWAIPVNALNYHIRSNNLR